MITSQNLDLHNLDIPLLVTYENDLQNNTNSQFLKETLINNNWEFAFIGEGKKWNGVKDKIQSYKDFLSNLLYDKIVVLSDARDVICLRSPKSLYDAINKIINNNKIIISTEMFLLGHMDWTEEQMNDKINKEPNFFFQGIPLNNYWKFYGKENDMPYSKYLNSGLICGRASEILKALNWITENNFKDDQLGFAHYTNNFPQLVHLDYEAKILHTSSFGVNGGFYDSDRQKNDSPKISEIYGFSNYFLHIPGLYISKGQSEVYNLIKHILKTKNITGNYISTLYGLDEQTKYNPKYNYCR